MSLEWDMQPSEGEQEASATRLPADPLVRLHADRLNRADVFRQHAIERLRRSALWAQQAEALLQNQPWDFQGFRDVAAAFAVEWFDAMDHHDAFEALLGADGSA